MRASRRAHSRHRGRKEGEEKRGKKVNGVLCGGHDDDDLRSVPSTLRCAKGCE
jgi:hypothetical protein